MEARKILLAVAGLAAYGTAPAAAAGDAVRVEPSTVEIGLGYHGARVNVAAFAPAGATAVFRIVGPAHDVSLKVKGRVAGILWAVVGLAHFSAVPSVLLVHEWPEAPPAPALEESGLLPEALAMRVLVPSDGAERRRVFSEMLRLFQTEGAYGVERSGWIGDGGELRTDFELPSASPPGRYAVDVTFFRDGRIVSREDAGFEVRPTGAVAMVSRFAREEGLWYGLGAVTVAVLAGLMTGVVFGRGAQGGH